MSLIDLKEVEKIEDNKFNDIFKIVQKKFKESIPIENKDSISNLALLDSTTNSNYGNSFFPIKRKRIIKNGSKGIFVPIATKKKLFLNYYSDKSDGVMHWSSDDAKDYLKAIKSTLNEFRPEEVSNE